VRTTGAVVLDGDPAIKSNDRDRTIVWSSLALISASNEKELSHRSGSEAALQLKIH
jgi:hypothetical protein